MEGHLALGRQGEEVAADYLRSLGYKVWGRNMRVGPHDEIDILAHDEKENVLVFAEVKTRSHADENFRPELGANERKRSALRRAVRAWVARFGYEGGYRIDLISVVGNSVVAHIRELSWE